jgi:hypothetical protein
MTKPLGLLLVPFPYAIVDTAFKSSGLAPIGDWGWFNIEQKWLPKKADTSKRRAFVSYILDLIQKARSQNARIDGVILPELALDGVCFNDLARALIRDKGIDFLISGVSRDQIGRTGNFVATAPFFLLAKERTENALWKRFLLIREKHHRWKLDKNQIEAYGLRNRLCEDKSWWENLSILSRSLDVIVYRATTTLTTLICEDLARVDPCQGGLRAVGPNLLVALLMDGPQLTARWPGRYAASLADDPGTSVLTLTSFGLIARQNKIGSFEQASSIALWKDEVTGIRKLELPRDMDAIALQLRQVFKNEKTLDGRTDNNLSDRWEYDGHVAVAVPNRPDWIHSGVCR